MSVETMRYCQKAEIGAGAGLADSLGKPCRSLGRVFHMMRGANREEE
jgi:hypothetical protein